MEDSYNAAGNMQNGLGRAARGIFFLAFLFFLNFLSRVLFSPLLPLIKEELQLNNSQSGSLFFFIPLAFMAGGGLIPLLIGIIGDMTSIGTGIAVAGCGIFVAGCVALVLLRAVVEENAEI